MQSSKSWIDLTRLFTSQHPPPSRSSSPNTKSPTTPPLTPTTFQSLLPRTASRLTPTINDWLRSSSPPAKHPRPHAFYEPLKPGSVKPRSRSSRTAHERSVEWRASRAGLQWDGEDGERRGRGRTRHARTARERQQNRQPASPEQSTTSSPDGYAQERPGRSVEAQGPRKPPPHSQRLSPAVSVNLNLDGPDMLPFRAAAVVVERRRQRRKFHGAFLQSIPTDGHFAGRARSQDARVSGQRPPHDSASATSTAQEAGRSHGTGGEQLNDGNATRKTDTYLQVPPPQWARPERERVARSRAGTLRAARSVSAIRQTPVPGTGNVKMEKKPFPVYRPYVPGDRPSTVGSSTLGRQDAVELEVPCTGSSGPRPTELMYDVGRTAMEVSKNEEKGEVVVGDVRIPGVLVPGAGVWASASGKQSVAAGLTKDLSGTPRIGSLDMGEELTEMFERCMYSGIESSLPPRSS